jgi:hypothetical protein
MVSYTHKLFIAVPYINDSPRERKLQNLQHRIPGCPEQFMGFKEYFPEQLETIEGDAYLYDFGNPSRAYYHPAIAEMFCQQINRMDRFEKWFIEYQESLDKSYFEESKPYIRDYESSIKLYTPIYLELMKPISTPHKQLLKFLQRVFYYQLYFLLIYRDQLLEPIADCQKQFSLGTLVQ